MSASRPLPAFEELNEYYQYNPNTGIIILKKARCRADLSRIGKAVGCLGGPIRRKTWTVKHKGKSYYLSRIAWILMTKKDPGDLIVEHINRNPQDNRWNNLRLATATENNYNKVSVGYTKRKDNNNYRVRITVGGTRITIGEFENEEDAKASLALARQCFYGDFAYVPIE
jgi:hypothetical protein